MAGDRILRAIRWGALALNLLLSLTARAQVAVTTQAVNVRAGPDRSFPLVAWLTEATPVNVVGCVDGWRWCDVVVGPHRGWVYSGFLAYSYQGQPTVILYGGPQLGLPLLTFSIALYWDNYYRGRPWWNNRHYWYDRPPPPPPPAWRPPPPRPPYGGPRPPPRPPQGQPPQRPPPPPNAGKPPGSQPPAGNRPPGGRPPPGREPPTAVQPLPPGPRPGGPSAAGRPTPRPVPDSRK